MTRPITKTNSNSSSASRSEEDIIHGLPGGGHLHTIRNALKNQHASVMIGSGFSLNAEGGTLLTTWEPLINSLLADLYQNEAERNRARQAAAGVSGMLRLAQEYEAFLGRAQLEAKLNELLPDAGFVTPGELHTRLLSLLWTDIFTTNYDTLLERTLDKDRLEDNPSIKQRYQIVVSPDGLPFSRKNGQPRIVKLHGTLRSNSNLIVTEDDYRRYPTDFAAFVNTVQQSMLENVFCLIGFSGDDPNFLAWTGWARDRLGDKAANIYFISTSPISAGQRLLLEKRRIFPIQIAALGETPTGIDRKLALSRLLTYWEQEVPRARIEWPYLYPQSLLASDKPGVSHLVQWLQMVRLNRSQYPGWLVAPAQCRNRLESSSGVYWALLILQDVKIEIPTWLRLLVADEIAWIHDTSLTRLTVGIEKLFASFFEDSQKNDETTADDETKRTKKSVEREPIQVVIGDVVIERPSSQLQTRIKAKILIDLMRDAREDNRKSKMEHWENLLRKMDVDSLPEETQCALYQEKILYHLEHQEKAQTKSLVEKMQEVAAKCADHYWLVRAGALRGESGWDVEAGEELVRKGLRGIRRAIQSRGETVELTSRRLWAEWLHPAFDAGRQYQDNFRDDELAIELEVNAWHTRAAISNLEAQARKHQVQISRDSAPKNAKEKAPEDENVRTNIEHPRYLLADVLTEVEIADDAIQQCIIDIDADSIPMKLKAFSLRQNQCVSSARTYLRLIDRTALPPSIGRNSPAAKGLLASFKVLALLDDATTAVRSFIRACDSPLSRTSEALSPAIVAGLSQEAALELFNKMTAGLSSLFAARELDSASTLEIRLFFDSSSRLALRLGSDEAKRICDLAITLYSNHHLLSKSALHDAFGRFFIRGIRLLPSEVLKSYLPKFLKLSLSGDHEWDRNYSWPDFVMELPRNFRFAPSRQWDEVINTALVELKELQKNNGSAISNCIKRLDYLYHLSCMRQAQRNQYAQLLWKEVSADGIPRFKNFYTGAFVVWPAPRGINIQALYSKYLDATEVDAIERIEETKEKSYPTWQQPSDDYLVSLLLSAQKESHFRWNERTLIEAFQKVILWWNTEGSRLTQTAAEKNDSFLRGILQERLLRISQVISQVLVPHLSAIAIQRAGIDIFMEQIWKAAISINISLASMLFAGMTWWPDRGNEALDRAITAIDSQQNKSDVIYSLIASIRWLKRNETSTELTERYVAHIIGGITTGPEFLIEQKLAVITELLDSGYAYHLGKFEKKIYANLYALYERLYESNDGANYRFHFFALPLLRTAAARVVRSLGNTFAGAQDNDYWKACYATASGDPLFSVRKLML